MRDKLAITRRLIEQLPPGAITVEAARIAWWYNVRENGGMRLTQEGFDVLAKQLNIECYEFDVPTKNKLTQRTILELDRRLQMPYYIKRQSQGVCKLVFFGSREAVLANLYGDLNQFLQNYS